MSQNVATDPNVVFQTVQVDSDSVERLMLLNFIPNLACHRAGFF
jgi:hypothetical protein